MALVAVLLAILFLYLIMQTYEFKMSGGPSAAMVGKQFSLMASALFSGF
jgi:hypothetical protein